MPKESVQGLMQGKFFAFLLCELVRVERLPHTCSFRIGSIVQSEYIGHAHTHIRTHIIFGQINIPTNSPVTFSKSGFFVR